MQSATVRVGVPGLGATSRFQARLNWAHITPVLMPWLLMVIGAAVGYPFTLDTVVAGERLAGIVVAGLLAGVTVQGLRHVQRPAAVLIGVSALALVGAVWIVAAAGPDVFRGTVGAWLKAAFRPVVGLARVTDPIGIANTRYIVGYNGLADLCLVAGFCCGALLLQRSRAWPVLALVVLASSFMLIGTGARGALTGVMAGVCAVAIVLWPRRLVALALLAAPLAIVLAALGVLDKGLEFSSTAGRLTYWGDVARLLLEYPLTGVGLGVDTAYRATVAYQINPDPERVFYAHNTFVQSYLEMGPLGALGMLAVPLVGLVAGIAARTRGFEPARRPLLIAGLGIVAAMEAHGLTDQVVTTNVGTAIVLLALAAMLASLGPLAMDLVARSTRVFAAVVAVLVVVLGVTVLLLPQVRTQALLNLGGLELAQALALDRQNAVRPAALDTARATLSAALVQDASHPAVLRQLAHLHAAEFDDAAAMRELATLTKSPRLDAFDMLQVAQLNRDLGSADDAFEWAARAYAMWGRPPEEGVMQEYARATLSDPRAQDLATRAEAAMLARHFGDARDLFGQALAFEPNSTYLRDRVGGAERAVTKYGP